MNNQHSLLVVALMWVVLALAELRPEMAAAFVISVTASAVFERLTRRGIG